LGDRIKDLIEFNEGKKKLPPGVDFATGKSLETPSRRKIRRRRR